MKEGKSTTMKKAARSAAKSLLDAAMKKKGPWTVDENRNWTRAYNALCRIVGEEV